MKSQNIYQRRWSLYQHGCHSHLECKALLPISCAEWLITWSYYFQLFSHHSCFVLLSTPKDYLIIIYWHYYHGCETSMQLIWMDVIIWCHDSTWYTVSRNMKPEKHILGEVQLHTYVTRSHICTETKWWNSRWKFIYQCPATLRAWLNSIDADAPHWNSIERLCYVTSFWKLYLQIPCRYHDTILISRFAHVSCAKHGPRASAMNKITVYLVVL